MMRTAALAVSLLTLAACATPSLPDPGPIKEPEPIAVDPRLCAPAEPEPAVAGSIVSPVTPAEVAAVRDHLTSDAESRAWGRRGWALAAIAAVGCNGLGVSVPTG